MSENLLDVRNLHTSFYTDEGIVKAVQDVSFSLKQGEVLGLVGESGCGKSVTALSIMGLIASPQGRITQGKIHFEGQDLLTSPLDQELVIRHVDDQSARFLRFAASTGLVPGCTLRILARDEAADTVTVELAGGGRLEMGHRAASKILAATP